MHLFELPPETFQGIVDACVAACGLDHAVGLRLVCRTFDREIYPSIVRTKSIEGDTTVNRRYWQQKRLAEEYVLGRLCGDRTGSYPLTAIFRETVSFIIDERGEETEDALRLYYTRLLCRASVQLGDLPLRALSDITDRPVNSIRARYHRPPRQGRPIDHALAAAAYLRMDSSVQQLLARGAKDCLTRFGTPLTCAAGAGNLEIVRTLLSHTTCDPKSWQKALAKASRYGHIEVVRLLVDFNKSTINKEDYRLAIRQATRGDQMEMLEFLLGQRDLFLKDSKESSDETREKRQRNWAESALWAACSTGNESIVRMALERGASPLPRPHRFLPDRQSIRLASSCGNDKALRLLLVHPKTKENGSLVRYVTRGLFEAAGTGVVRVAELLIEHGAQVNPERYDPHTAWVYAAFKGRIEMLEFLLERGADFHHYQGTVAAAGLLLENAHANGWTSIARLIEAQGFTCAANPPRNLRWSDILNALSSRPPEAAQPSHGALAASVPQAHGSIIPTPNSPAG